MSFWLVMQANDGRERRFALKNNTIIGREPTCDVRVPIPTVALKHCQLSLDGERVKLVDLRTNNGTFHNGNRVSEAVLSPDDTLTIGPVTFTIRVQHDAAAQPNGHADGAPALAPEIIIERHDNGTNGHLGAEAELEQRNINILHDGAAM